MEMSANSLRSAAVNDLVDDHLRGGAAVRFTVPTQSMWPTLHPGDQVVARGVKPAALHLGDILLVKQHNVWLAHRLIGRSIKNGGLSLLLKGDNSAEPDYPFPAADFCGILESVERAGRASSLRTRRAIGMGILLAGLSRLEASFSAARPRWLKRMLSKGSRLLVRGTAQFAKRVVEA